MWLGGRPGALRGHLPHGPAPTGPRHHPDLAVLHDGAQPLRVRPRPLAQRSPVGLDPRSRPQEDVEVQGQRGGPNRTARETQPRRGPLLGRQRPPRYRHCLRRGTDEGGTTACDQAAERQPVRVGVRGRPRIRPHHPVGSPRRDRGDRHRDDHRAGLAGHRCHICVRGVRLRTSARAHRGVVLGVLRRLSRTGQGACLRRGGILPRRGRLGAGRTRPGPLGGAASVRPVPAVHL